MTLIITQDGTTYDLLDYGIRTRDVLISSPTPEHELRKIEGARGVLDYGTIAGARSITVSYRVQAYDFGDFSLLRDEIFNIFKTEEFFYIIEKRVRWKRWRVKIADPYQIPQRNVFGDFELDFIGLDGVSESIKTSMDLDRDGLLYGKGWSYGMGLSRDPSEHKYSGESNKFSIYNPSDISIHPFEHDLKITLTRIVRDTFAMTNETTGDTFRLFKYVDASDVFVLDGSEMTYNETEGLRHTNRNYITLAKGWNNFTTTRTVKYEFDFRYYYN